MMTLEELENQEPLDLNAVEEFFLGLVNTKNLNNDAVSKFLNFLQGKFDAKKISELTLYQLLNLRNRVGWSVGNKIAAYGSKDLIEQYLNLLGKFADSKYYIALQRNYSLYQATQMFVSSGNIIRGVKYSVATFKDCFALRSSPINIELKQLMHDFIEESDVVEEDAAVEMISMFGAKKDSGESVVNSLVEINERGETKAHLAVKDNSISKCLALLHKEIKQNPSSKQSVMTLLKMQDNYGWTIGHLIALHASEDTLKNYLNLLSSLNHDFSGAIKQLQLTRAISQLANEYSLVTFVDCLVERKLELSGELVFILLSSDLLPASEWRKLLDYKDKVCDYILNLSDEEIDKKEILKNALNKKTILGQYLWTPRGDGNTDYNSGNLKKLKEKFIEIHQFDVPEKLCGFLKRYDFTEKFDLPYDVIADQKEALYDYIVKIDDLVEKRELVRHALTKNHSLRKLFECQRGFFETDLGSGTLKKLFDLDLQLNLFEKIKKEVEELGSNKKWHFTFYRDWLDYKEMFCIYILSIVNAEERNTVLEKAINSSHALGKFFAFPAGESILDTDFIVLKELECALETNYENMESLLENIINHRELDDEVFKQKEHLRYYIFSIVDLNKKLELLRDSLDPTTALGQFFHKQRGWFSPDQESGNLWWLKKAFDFFSTQPGAPELKLTPVVYPSLISLVISSVESWLNAPADSVSLQVGPQVGNPNEHILLEL